MLDLPMKMEGGRGPDYVHERMRRNLRCLSHGMILNSDMLVEESPESEAKLRQTTSSRYCLTLCLVNGLLFLCPKCLPERLAYGPTHWPDALSTKPAFLPFIRFFVE